MSDLQLGITILVGWFGGIASAFAIPWLIKSRHIARQNLLIEECRTRFILAVQHLADNDEPAARVLLDEIRAFEARWKWADSITSKVALGGFAILFGTLSGAALRWAPFAVMAIEKGKPLDLVNLAWVAGLSAMHTLFSYFTDWHSPWIVDDCGDRLEALLNAGRGVAAFSKKTKRGRLKDGLAAREVFGLELVFSQKQLSAARRRLAAQYHPDRWQAAPPGAAKAAEEAMKRINAAYDQLKATAKAA